MSLKRYFLAYTTAIALPLLLFGGAVVYWTAELYRQSLESEMEHTANALGLAIEMKIQGLYAAARAMAVSLDFEAGVQQQSLYDKARTVAARHLAWFALFDRSYAQLLNTRVPYSEPLPAALNKEAIAEAFAASEMVVSNLFYAAAVKENVLALYVPIVRNGKAQYVLAMAFDPRTLSELLLEQPVPEGGYAMVMDGNGHVIAHSRHHDRYLDVPVPVWMRDASRHADAIAAGPSIDGLPVTVSFFQLPSANWRLILAVPSSHFSQLSWNPVVTLVLASVPIILLSGLLAALFARRINRSITTLVSAAESMASPGTQQLSEPLSIAELRILQSALEKAAEAVRGRERERELRFIAESKQAAAESASRAKDEVITTLSHELRSPLNAILGWVHVLRRKKDDEATIARGIDVTERNVKHLTRLIEDLLDMSRIVSGRLPLQMSPVNLSELAAELVDTYRVDVEAKHQTLSADFEAGIWLQADKARLYQVLVNLLSNAIKFTPEGGAIRLELHRQDQHAVFSVKDSGIGIAPEVLPKIFQRFWQANSSQQELKGLGLGLAIVRHIVDAHGGVVRVTSPGADKGATFVVELPLAADCSA